MFRLQKNALLTTRFPFFKAQQQVREKLHPITLALLCGLMSTTLACDTPISCEDNDDCPVDRVCSADLLCVVPGGEPEGGTPEPTAGPGEPDAGPAAGPGAEPDGSPEPNDACADPPCFLMPDSETAVCEDEDGFPDNCPAAGEEAFGQDGNQVGPLTQYSFVSGGIQDDINEIVWQEGSSADAMPHANAVTFCDELEDGGRQWRLPTLRELFSILDFGRDPTVNAAFLRPADGVFHTSSNATATNQWYAVNLGDAFRGGGQTVGATGNSVAFTKCVSGPEFGGANFVRVGNPSDSVAMDVQTGVYFQYVANESEYWGDALAVCQDLVLNGDDDWRLPTAKDAVLLLDPPTLEVNRAVHPFFSVTPNSIWTSTVAHDNEFSMNQLTGQFSTASPGNARGFYCARGPDRIPLAP